MKTTGQIIGLLLFASGGYAAGVWFADSSRSSRLTEEPSGGSDSAKNNSVGMESREGEKLGNAGGALRDPRTGATFAESLDRLDHLAKRASAPMGGAAFLVEGERRGKAQLEIERIFALASRSEVLAFFADSVDETTESTILKAAYGRLAEFSISEALAIWEDQLERCGNNAGIDAIVRAWSRNDPGEAERWIDGLTKTRDRQAALFAFLDEIMERSPDIVDRRLFEINELWPSLHLSNRFINQLEPSEFSEVADRFLSRRHGKWQYQNQVAELLSVWGESDRSAMIRWLVARPDGELRGNVISRVTNSLSKTDPATLVREIGPLVSDNQAFSEMAGQAWIQWLKSDEDPAEAIAWFENHGENLTVGLGFNSWPKEDTIRVIDRVATLPESESRKQIVEKLLYELSDADPKDALSYGKKHLLEGNGADDFFAGALSKYVRKGEDPEWALDWATENFDNAEARNQAVRWVMSAWTERDPEAAAQRASRLSGKLREEAFSGIVGDWVEKDPKKLLDFVKAPPDPKSAPYLAKSSFWQFGYKKGGDYLSEAMAMPEGEVREQAVRGLFSGWARANLETSAVALDRMKDGSLRDTAISEFVQIAGWEDRQLAIAWSLAITDPEQRRRNTMEQMNQWLRADRDAAVRWIEANDKLPSEWKSELLTKGKP